MLYSRFPIILACSLSCLVAASPIDPGLTPVVAAKNNMGGTQLQTNFALRLNMGSFPITTALSSAAMLLLL